MDRATTFFSAGSAGYMVRTSWALGLRIIKDRGIELTDYVRINEEVVPYILGVTRGDINIPDRYLEYVSDSAQARLLLHSSEVKKSITDYEELINNLKDSLSTLKPTDREIPICFLDVDDDTISEALRGIIGGDGLLSSEYNKLYATPRELCDIRIKKCEDRLTQLEYRSKRTDFEMQLEFGHTSSDTEKVLKLFRSVSEWETADAVKYVVSNLKSDQEIRAYLDLISSYYFSVLEGKFSEKYWLMVTFGSIPDKP